MADLELGTLPDRLADEEIAFVMEKLRTQVGDASLKMPDGDITLSGNYIEGIDDDLLAEFLDRLEISDAGCEYYVPVEFDRKLDCGGYCVGSVFYLVEVLEEMMDDLDIEDPDDDFGEVGDEDDYASDLELLHARLRVLWRAFYDAAGEALEAQLTLVVAR